MTRRLVPTLLAAAALAAPAAASARAPKGVWATVNLCNTPQQPNKMGVRGHMPGNGTRERMFMRFNAQYQTAEGWKPVTGQGASRWFYVGSAIFKSEELGYTFAFDAPQPGAGYVLRGLVRFEWRAKRRVNGHTRMVVMHRAHAYTAAGHPTRESDPKGFSAATCHLGS